MRHEQRSNEMDIERLEAELAALKSKRTTKGRRDMKVDYIFKQGSYRPLARLWSVEDASNGTLMIRKVVGIAFADIEVDGAINEKDVVFFRFDDGRVRPVKTPQSNKRMAEEARNAGNVEYRWFWELKDGSRVTKWHERLIKERT